MSSSPLSSDPSAPADPALAPQPVIQATRGALGTGLFRTVAGKTLRRQLEIEADSLRSFLACRAGCLNEAQLLFEELERWLERRSSQDLREGPSFHAVVYRAARDLLISYREEHAPSENPRAIPWEPVRSDAPHGYGELLDALRRELGDESEVLDLRWARGLGMGEIAFVLRCSVDEAETRLKRATAWAEFVRGDLCAADLGQALYDVFQVLPDALSALGAVARSRPIRLGVGTVLGERYRIEACVGGGEFGYVYRASDVRVPGHIVALKMMHHASRTAVTREGTLRELTRIASATHPSLVQLKEHGWWQDRLWFTMPWYRGETLEARLQREPLNVREVARIGAQISRALAALHDVGLVHQDVKPDNILLAEMGSGASAEILPVLLDLGVASPEENVALAGTPLYFAPEAASAVTDPEATVAITGKADVFSLGLTLLHALRPSARPEVEDDDVPEFIAARAMSATTIPWRGTPRVARRALGHALVIDPLERPSAAEFAASLATIAQPSARALAPALSATLGALVLCGAAFSLTSVAVQARQERMEASDAAADLAALESLLTEERTRAEALERALEEARRPRVAER